MILTLDLGTTVTKAVVWNGHGPVAVGRAGLSTSHPNPGWAEQDAGGWWTAVREACRAARASDRDAWNAIRAVCFAAARETFVPVCVQGRPLGPGILWSDRRATTEAAALSVAYGGEEALHQRTGMPIDAGAMVAKARWLGIHAPGTIARTRWLLAPRDLIVLRLTGVAVTDATLASRTGFYCLDGTPLPEPLVDCLPTVAPSTAVVGSVLPAPAAALDLAAGTQIVLGGGDRACELLGTRATSKHPMISWGTTANVAVPLDATSQPVPPGVVRSAGALGGAVHECGLSAAGAALEWLAGLTGHPVAELVELASVVPPGSNGVLACGWLNGARAPWWHPHARAAFVGLTAAHGPAEMARALMEAVAFDIARCLEALGISPETVVAAGGGSVSEVWPHLIGAVTACPVERRNPELAGAAGARIVAGVALGEPVELDDINPTTDRLVPDPAAVASYGGIRRASDEVAAAVLELG